MPMDPRVEALLDKASALVNEAESADVELYVIIEDPGAQPEHSVLVKAVTHSRERVRLVLQSWVEGTNQKASG